MCKYLKEETECEILNDVMYNDCICFRKKERKLNTFGKIEKLINDNKDYVKPINLTTIFSN
jgi:hypothetical protein